MNDICPGCGGPITYSPDESNGITVYFHCANPKCKWGKPNPKKDRNPSRLI